MQTYTHFLVALALSGPLGRFLDHPNRKFPPLSCSAFLFGSTLPDLPLIVTAIVAMTIDKINNNGNVVNRLFGDWYFHNPWVKAEHNLFHSPITLLTMIGLAYTLWRRAGYQRAAWVFWALSSALLHSTCDVPVHHDDGPLILFPINWEYRFRSPVSYWDPQYHGHEFAVCEHIMDLFIILRQCCIYAMRPKAKEEKDVELTALTNKLEI